MFVTSRPNRRNFCCLYLFLKTRKSLQCCFFCFQTSVHLILVQVVTDDGMRMVVAAALNAKMKPFLFHLFTIWLNAEIVSHFYHPFILMGVFWYWDLFLHGPAKTFFFPLPCKTSAFSKVLILLWTWGRGGIKILLCIRVSNLWNQMQH